MNTSFLIANFAVSGALWRAAFVAALAVIIFVLTRYWKSLSAHSNRTRYLLISLRGVSMLLLAAALVGLRIEYKTDARPQVFVYSRFAKHTDEGARKLEETNAVARIVASLNNSDIEVIELPGINDATSERDGLYPSASILVTDGAFRAEEARREIERIIADSGGGPVFVLTDVQKNDSPRVALTGISVMSRPVRGVPIQVRCLVHARGMRGRSSLVTVADDAQVRVSAEARWTGDDERQVLSMEVVPKVAGWINYSVRIEPAGNEHAATLSRSFTVFAEERRQRILILEGEPTWEAKFIRRALEKADLFDVDYFAQVSRAAMVGLRDSQTEGGTETTRSTQSASTGKPDVKLREVLSSAERLNYYDCILVGATPDTLLSNAEATRVREWIERRGGGLVVLGGNNFTGSIVAAKGKMASLMPAEIVSSSFRSASQTIVRNAPVEAEKSSGRYLLIPTESGGAGALHGYANAIEGNAQSNALTGDGLRLGTLRAGTTVLAVSGQSGGKGTSEDGTPLIATMRYGAGRSIVFAPADSWRMRTAESSDQTDTDGPFASLWQGISMWAGLNASPPVEIVISENSPEAGAEATVEIRVRDATYSPLTIEKISGRLQQLAESDNTSQVVSIPLEVPFKPDRDDSSIWRARFTAPPLGRYELQVNYTSNGKSGTVGKYFATVPPSSIEDGASRDTLQRVARATGGELFTDAHLKSLSDKLAALSGADQNVRRTLELRSWWPLAIIIPLLLSCEWLIVRLSNRSGVTSLKFEEEPIA